MRGDQEVSRGEGMRRTISEFIDREWDYVQMAARVKELEASLVTAKVIS